MRRSLPKIETGRKKRERERGVFAEVNQGCQIEGGVAEMLRSLRTVLSGPTLSWEQSGCRQ